MLQLLTTTGLRPDAFALCVRWMRRQTYTGNVRWIIVDDGERAQALPEGMPEAWEIVHVRPEPFWRDGDKTQPRNLCAGLAVAQDDAPVVIIEDDDWYSADYLAVTADRLKRADMVGVGPQRWANVRFQRVGQYPARWPWNSCIAFQPSAFAHMVHIASTRAAYVDRDGWELFDGRKAFFEDGRVVGIKGLPGRTGYMPCHVREQGTRDPGMRTLRRWIGNDVEAYL